MTKKYYLDTCIWRDYYENRVDRFRPLGEWAFELIKLIRENKDKIIYSKLVLDELRKDFNEEKIIDILSVVFEEGILEKISETPKEMKKARNLSKKFKIPKADCLHAILAKRNNAVLVTRDKHLIELQYFVEIKKPEDLI